MTKTLRQATQQLYIGVAGMFHPIPSENKQAVAADLKAYLFVGHGLNSAAPAVYHRYSMLLAPLNATLTMAKHCQFEHQRCVSIAPAQLSDGGESNNPLLVIVIRTGGTAKGIAKNTGSVGYHRNDNSEAVTTGTDEKISPVC